ncbi:hypothetical protein PQ469_19800 [Mucilaginibacter sp. KACC 22773]|uniref:hypothetical protein n=1 Tax=Mucilaginibacter sp. KACC 22773 TaxID=3025671 RepID=UPI0023664C5D|nr:hypothetical protein [Mucilaginibacter sp. KACC 22773]WDF76137.1 hypothetical protein PQ469_19800 [Mucilaginibacter sp. KACC 22773]
MRARKKNRLEKTLKKLGGGKYEVAFQEERLLEFRSIQNDFQDYITQTFASYTQHSEARNSIWEPEFLIEGQGLRSKLLYNRKVSDRLDDLFKVILYEDPIYGFHDAAVAQIAGFEKFVVRRTEKSVSSLGEKEQKLIQKIQLSIDFYRANNTLYLYNAFKKALAEYFVWLEHKIHKSTLFIIYLHGILEGAGNLVDFRELLRTIMHFLCRRLDEENDVNQKNSNPLSNFFYWSTRVNHEYRKYSSNYQGLRRGSCIYRIESQ